jgi:hypothetical protein
MFTLMYSGRILLHGDVINGREYTHHSRLECEEGTIKQLKCDIE